MQPILKNFGFSDEHQSLFDMAFRYAEDKLYPLVPKMDDDDWFPADAYQAMREVGLLGVTIPEQYGGAGLDFISQALIAEALTYWNHAFSASWGASENLCINNIVRNANEAQKAKYLPRFVEGAIGALGLTEPGAGSDALGSMATTAKRVGDEYILNGRKMFITNGPVADILLIYAKTNPEAGAHGISAFIVEKEFEGFSVAQKLDKMGWRGSPTGELVFEDCRVPAENLVGGENAGVAVVMSGLNIERTLLCSSSIGMAQRALDLSLDYARDRKQFGKSIGQFQLVQGMIADMYTDIETLRATSYQMLKELNELERGGGGRGPVHLRTAMNALYAGRAIMRVLDNAVQIHGGMGFMRETEVNRLYRSGKILEIGAGTNQVRQGIIAQELLKG
ncbi:acyl-CoA dehydrogenase family protein [Kordiimonas marina]|uniref:acyl-CoA dehydrogenase family protein n=1 Tax=Kordiimonas marina TaxID=2872312 RepID=UPI001FF607B4|nr:acyl-CoA dehydrogenase family protein [Kordiimonas marina]MCJ9427738.1 acyl-CoA dehydrogenase family protein [Kordiimonas marina]